MFARPLSLESYVTNRLLVQLLRMSLHTAGALVRKPVICNINRRLQELVLIPSEFHVLSHSFRHSCHAAERILVDIARTYNLLA
jgi:hypothetical protein